jgi:uncharacterized protein (TIGR03435 family)
MRNHTTETQSWRNLALATAALMALTGPVLLGIVEAPRLQARAPTRQSPATQSSVMPQWQIAAGGKKSFDVASVKENKSGTRPSSNFPLNAGAAYSPSGGLLSGVNQPLYAYIIFAYKTTNYQNLYLLSQLPKWVTADRFDIEARAAEANPTKDQMRLMMQSLLADRFKLVVHIETRQLPVYGLVLEKPGKMGPYLRQHSDNPPCAAIRSPGALPPANVDGVYPTVCGDILHPPSAPGRIRNAARDVTIGFMASSFTLGGMSNDVDRAVLDQTGLSGTFDFSLEYTPLLNGQPPGGFPADMTGPTFLEALKEQLGLKLVPQTGPVDVLVIDHIEEPSPN